MKEVISKAGSGPETSRLTEQAGEESHEEATRGAWHPSSTASQASTEQWALPRDRQTTKPQSDKRVSSSLVSLSPIHSELSSQSWIAYVIGGTGERREEETQREAKVGGLSGRGDKNGYKLYSVPERDLTLLPNVRNSSKSCWELERFPVSSTSPGRGLVGFDLLAESYGGSYV